MTAGGRFTSPTGSNITTGQIRRVVKCCSTNVFIPLQRVYWFQSEVCNAVKEMFRPHKVYLFLISMSVSTQTRLSVKKLSGWNFPKSLIFFAGSI